LAHQSATSNATRHNTNKSYLPNSLLVRGKLFFALVLRKNSYAYQSCVPFMDVCLLALWGGADKRCVLLRVCYVKK
jgi:hypothetical protein